MHLDYRIIRAGAIASATAIFMLFLAGLSLKGQLALAEQDQVGKNRFLPNVQAPARGGFLLGGASLAGMDGMDGMEGFGSSRVHLINPNSSPASAEFKLIKYDTTIKTLQPKLASMQVEHIDIADHSGQEFGNFHIESRADIGMGILTDSRWAERGSVYSYVGRKPDDDVILPIIARDVMSHTSILGIQNASSSQDPNQIELTFFDPQGGIQKQMTVKLDKGRTTEYDLIFDVQFEDLPKNAAGGYLGSVRVTDADGPTVLLNVGDELGGTGTAALASRTVGEAAASQALPIIRSNYLGDSLIAIANADMMNPTDITIRYQGHPNSPSGAGETFEQSFTIAARSQAFVDLSNRGRGSVPSPSIPRGSGANRGFYGSAIIEANGGKILASVLEGIFSAPTARTASAFHGFGPADLSAGFIIPELHADASGLKTHIVLMNPSASTVTARFTQADLDTAQVDIPPGGMQLVSPITGHMTQTHSLGRIEASAPIAALIYDTAFASPADWGNWDVDSSIAWAVQSPSGDVATSVPTDTPEPSDTPTPSVVPPDPSETPVEPGPTDTPGGSDDFVIYLPFGERDS